MSIGSGGISGTMTRLTGGQALVRGLRVQGVDVVFGLPGIQLDWAFDALYAERDTLRVIHTRHEQAVSYMADGYARTTGRVGVGVVVPGPGLLNASAGLATAYACSSPVLCITGRFRPRTSAPGAGCCTKSATSWARCVLSPNGRRARRARRRCRRSCVTRSGSS